MEVGAQQKQLKSQAKELERKREEFEAATANMSEGLVVLNEQGEILSVNRTASDILGTSDACLGKDILSVNGSAEMQEMLRQARTGENAEITVSVGGRDFRFNASPVVTEKKVAGIALLIFDITEKEKAEQMRREFTANVSHELKTPLHTISGYAELLANGMVEEKDTAEFSQKIYAEAQRMIRLVEDIIRLSNLDEGATELAREEADLCKIAEKAVESLAPAAEKENVSVEFSGEKAELSGIPQLLSAIVYNLTDNAIKYNHSGGKVFVSVTNVHGGVLLSVKDTGIGIPKDQQERVFERFYRVDKSHSKEVGGTGLGLSIVKHAAKLHGAKITLESEPGKGTEIAVLFPKSACDNS